MKPILSAALAILLAGCMSAAPPPELTAVAWTQFGLGDEPDLIARVLVDRAADCPTVEWNGHSERMTLRAAGRVEALGKLCESRKALTDAVNVRIRLGNIMLLEQRITRQPERIAVLGDTGCRLTYYADQGCNDQKTWPFASLAAAAAGQQPDLVLHLGDYYYREAPCLASSTTCIPGPYGDREATWRAEFFEPARPLLARAPWVFVRGNHEDCQRGGYGWSYYFGDDAAACDTVHKPAHIRLNGLTLVNFDNAATGNRFLAAELNRSWDDLARSLAERPPAIPGAPILLMTHEPAYFVCVAKKTLVLQPCPAGTVDSVTGVRRIAEAARRSGWRAIVLSGHIHAFRAIDAAPPGLGGGQAITQVVVGTSGANQDEDPSTDAMLPPSHLATTFAGGIPIKVQGWTDFGFGMLTASRLELVMFDTQGRPKFSCALADEAKSPRCR
jgi:hypothetical protein